MTFFTVATFPAGRRPFWPSSSTSCPSASKFFRGREGQAALAVEEFFQPPVAGTALAPVDAGRDKLAAFAPRTAACEPVLPTDRAFNRNARDV